MISINSLLCLNLASPGLQHFLLLALHVVSEVVSDVADTSERRMLCSDCFRLHSVSNNLRMKQLAYRVSTSSLEGLVALPLHSYCLVRSNQRDQLLVEAGVVQQDGSKLVCQQTYHNGHCTTISIGHEVVAS